MKTAEPSPSGVRARIPAEHTGLREILTDRKLAELGDAYVNFIYSLALSSKSSQPQGARVQGRVLSQALRKAGLRSLLPSRTDRHSRADAAEAVIAFSWIKGLVGLDESVDLLEERLDEPVEAFAELLKLVVERLRVMLCG